VKISVQNAKLQCAPKPLIEVDGRLSNYFAARRLFHADRDGDLFVPAATGFKDLQTKFAALRFE
jgi:hypothetical protein